METILPRVCLGIKIIHRQWVRSINVENKANAVVSQAENEKQIVISAKGAISA